ncbi:hypothetical protein ID866_10524 [Astraeus odoratus]|nr:hypothetical protein ID866_10524 [Astraeus odoratus]
MTTHSQVALEAIMSSRWTPQAINQFQSFSACHNSAPPLHTSTQQTSAGASLTYQNNDTMGTPQTPSHPGNPGNPSGDDLGDDPGDDPFNDNDNGDNKNNNKNVDEATNVLQALGHAIKNLTCTTWCDEESSASSRKMRVHKPDTFNSMDLKKLHTFLVQCKLNFQDHPCIFCLDCSKVMFAQSYLRGMALEWFELDLLSSSNPEDHPLWMDNWKEFVTELQSMFGPHNLVADAKNQLDYLQMKDGQCINKYVVEFNRLASQVCGYRDGALCHYFYSGLPDCIKDEICQEIDACYWECKEEIQWANRHQTSTQNSSNKSSSSTPNSGHNKSTPNSALSSKSNSNDKKSTNTLLPNPKLSNKLGKDGKLMVAEHKRHYNLKLCMFCGGNSHFTDKCKKKVAKNKAKAHAAKVTESPQEQSGSTLGSAPEVKK